MYLVVSTLVQKFDFDFGGLKEDNFEVLSDQFAIDIKGKAVLNAHVANHDA